MIPAILLGALGFGILLALVLGKAIRIADERDGALGMGGVDDPDKGHYTRGRTDLPYPPADPLERLWRQS